jgi:hypothetical protein
MPNVVFNPVLDGRRQRTVVHEVTEIMTSIHRRIDVLFNNRLIRSDEALDMKGRKPTPIPCRFISATSAVKSTSVCSSSACFSYPRQPRVGLSTTPCMVESPFCMSGGPKAYDGPWLRGGVRPACGTGPICRSIPSELSLIGLPGGRLLGPAPLASSYS